jgi:hypothetical protein
MAHLHCGATSAWYIEVELQAVLQGVPIALQPIRVLYPQAVETPGGMASQQSPLTICADTSNPCAPEAASSHPAGNSFEILTVAALSGFIAGQQIPAAPPRRVELTKEISEKKLMRRCSNSQGFWAPHITHQTILHCVKPDELSNVRLCLRSTSLCKSRT